MSIIHETKKMKEKKKKKERMNEQTNALQKVHWDRLDK